MVSGRCCSRRVSLRRRVQVQRFRGSQVVCVVAVPEVEVVMVTQIEFAVVRIDVGDFPTDARLHDQSSMRQQRLRLGK
jgi:hypothetical protein